MSEKEKGDRIIFFLRVKSIANSSQITLLTTGYSYNAKGQLQQMTYPSGKKVGYQYNSNGKLIGLTLNGKTLLSNITWSPLVVV